MHISESITDRGQFTELSFAFTDTPVAGLEKVPQLLRAEFAFTVLLVGLEDAEQQLLYFDISLRQSKFPCTHSPISPRLRIVRIKHVS